jgi:hypothetical protein
MAFLPEHVNPILLTLGAMAIAARLDRRRWWLVGVPAVLGLVTGFLVDVTGASVRAVPVMPFVVEVATIVTLGGLAYRRHVEPTP